MRKHEKNRIKGIKQHQKLAKAKKRVYDAYAKLAGSRPDSALFADQDLIVGVVQSLSTKTLKMIVENPDRFVFPRKDELYRLAHDAIVLRALEIEK